MSAITESNTLPPGTVLLLNYHGQEISSLPQQTPYIIGRDSGIAHLAVPITIASRDHFRILYRRGKFVLADNSTNGTYVQMAGGESIHLKREEVPIIGDTAVSIGKPIDIFDENIIKLRL